MTNSSVDLLYLPDDLLLICLARVSRLYYPILSLVSKRFRSLLASLELYDIRKLLGRTETCLYVSLRFSDGSNPRWFTLCRRPTPIPNPSCNTNSRWFTSCFKPYKNLKNRIRKEENKSSEKFMVSVPTRNDCPQFGLTSILGTTIGSNIYMIGGQINGVLSSPRVFILDCRSHTWHEAPSMQMFRTCPHVSVLDGKIYVVDRKIVSNPSNLIEFFDPKTQIWEHVSIPIELLHGSYITKNLVFDGKLYLFGYNKIVVYKPKEQVWDVVGLGMRLYWVSNASSCVIDNIVYCFSVISRRIICYDFEGRSWRVLRGLKKLPKLPKLSRYIRLVDCGGKIAVLWEKQVRAIGGSDKKMIWCAEIALERSNAQEIYGKIEWCNVVLTVPKSCTLLQFNAVTL